VIITHGGSLVPVLNGGLREQKRALGRASRCCLKIHSRKGDSVNNSVARVRRGEIALRIT